MKEESKEEDVKNVLEPLDEKQKLFACPQCPIKFERNKSRSKHVRECHSKTTCHYCYSSYDEITIKKHIEFYHSSFKCSECGKAFTRRQALSYHYSRYHSETADEFAKIVSEQKAKDSKTSNLLKVPDSEDKIIEIDLNQED